MILRRVQGPDCGSGGRVRGGLEKYEAESGKGEPAHQNHANQSPNEVREARMPNSHSPIVPAKAGSPAGLRLGSFGGKPGMR